jgi:phosphomannomutase
MFLTEVKKMIDIFSLKSGSDIRGVASGENIELTDEVVDKIIRAFIYYISDRRRTEPSALTVSVGNDSRLSAERLSSCVCGAVASCGASVLNCGLISTPAMFMTTLKSTLDCDAAIMITASHLPADKNGLKFFTKDGGLEGSEINTILNIANSGKYMSSPVKGSIKEIDFTSVYSDILLDKIRGKTGEKYPLKGFKIIVDAGNGAGGFYVEKVLKPLGANTDGSQFLEPDGSFPNHIPNPENKEAMESICSAVIKNKADLGIIFDTDVDRAGAVADNGEEINRNRLIALISAILLEEKRGAYIVTDSITSDGLTEFIEERGGRHHRFRRGYKNVINEALRLNKEGKYCPLAIETSGHAAFAENYFLDDGAYLITRLLIKMAQMRKRGEKLISLIENLKCAAEETEIRMGFKIANFKEYGLKVLEKLKEYALSRKDYVVAPVNYEGLRASFNKDEGDGWFLLRLSLHDPIMPLNIESNSKGGTYIIARKLYEFLKDFDGLDVTNLKNYINE